MFYKDANGNPIKERFVQKGSVIDVEEKYAVDNSSNKDDKWMLILAIVLLIIAVILGYIYFTRVKTSEKFKFGKFRL